MLDDIRDNFDDDMFIGVVEDVDDPKRMGRVKVRVDRLHGRVDDSPNIPTEDLPWAMPTIDRGGYTFSIPSVGKVVRLSFTSGDFYKPVYKDATHYNYNLQEKLQSLPEENYREFYTNNFDDKHQYYHDKDEGVVFDYVKSRFNIDPQGNMTMHLRDNSSKAFLGSPDASEPAILGNHWMEWFDDLVQNLMGAKGGPYLGNFGAPVIPNPGMLEVLNKYLAIRPTFLSDHVFIVDDQRVKTQEREFDLNQHNDNYNDERLEKVKTPEDRGYIPQQRSPAGDNPQGVPPDNFSSNLSSSNLPDNPTQEEAMKTSKPFSDDYGNGEIPIEKMVQNRYLRESFTDERSYLLSEASSSLTRLLDSYKSQKNSSMPDIKVNKGYHNLERQTNIKQQYPSRSPRAGEDPFGWANQVELYFGVNKRDTEEVNRLRKYLRYNKLSDNPSQTEKTLDWLVKNGKKNNWRLTGRDALGNQQWWHWIYDPTI